MPIVYVVCSVFYYDTTPLLDGEFCVSAKRAEALEFLFREVRVCGWHGEGGMGCFCETGALLKCRIGVGSNSIVILENTLRSIPFRNANTG